jgi:PAT family beta-lactamase induction signal transducer AmpG
MPRVRLFNRRTAILVLLGFSSGLPLLLIGSTLQAWLTRAGLSLTDLGLATLVALPYTLKPLWAPLLDSFCWGRLGRRRGWMLATQAVLVAALIGMSFQHPPDGIPLLLANAVLVAIASATQDIAVDAWRLEVLDEAERGAGAAASMTGYRGGMLVAGGLALVLFDHGLSWPMIYVLMAGAQTIGLVGTWLAHEPAQEQATPPLLDLLWLPLVDFVRRLGPGIIAVMLFIVLFKLPDALAAKLTVPFLLRSGYSEGDVGIWQSSLGMGATILGMIIGGWAFARLGTNRSLWIFGILQGGSNLAYAALAWWLLGHPPSIPALAATVMMENLCGGLAVSAFVSYLMGLCTHRFAATQFALVTALTALGRDVVAACAGFLVDVLQLSWPMFFLATAIVALPSLALLPLVAPWLRLNVAPRSP